MASPTARISARRSWTRCRTLSTSLVRGALRYSSKLVISTNGLRRAISDKKYGPIARPVFVSCDPARDDIPQVKKYISGACVPRWHLRSGSPADCRPQSSTLAPSVLQALTSISSTCARSIASTSRPRLTPRRRMTTLSTTGESRLSARVTLPVAELSCAASTSTFLTRTAHSSTRLARRLPRRRSSRKWAACLLSLFLPSLADSCSFLDRHRSRGVEAGRQGRRQPREARVEHLIELAPPAAIPCFRSFSFF